MLELAQQARRAPLRVPSLSSTFGDDFVESVCAFQKVQGLERTGAVDAAFWTRLDNPRDPAARATPSRPNHIEVDKTHQVLYLVRGGKIALISPVSTAGIAGYYTPEGRFAIYRKVAGWDHEPARRPARTRCTSPAATRSTAATVGAAVPGLARLRPRAGLRDRPAVRTPSRTARRSTSTRRSAGRRRRRVLAIAGGVVWTQVVQAGDEADRLARRDRARRPRALAEVGDPLVLEQRQVTRYLARTFPQRRAAVPAFDFAHRRLVLVAAGPALEHRLRRPRSSAITEQPLDDRRTRQGDDAVARPARVARAHLALPADHDPGDATSACTYSGRADHEPRRRSRHPPVPRADLGHRPRDRRTRSTGG